MKKITLLLCLLAASFVSYAANKKAKHISKPENITIQKQAAKPLMQECATAVTTYQGETIVCIRCAETMGGPNGAEAKAADCLMDAMMEMNDNP